MMPKPHSHGGVSESCAEVFTSLLASASHRRTRGNLENLNKALRHLVSVGSNSFSLANVARAVDQLGLQGPKEQSLKNRGGVLFRELITVFAREHCSVGAQDTTGERDLVTRIDDPQARAEVQYLLSEKASLQRRLDMLKAQFSRMQPISAATLSTEDVVVESFRDMARGEFSPLHIGAIRRFLRNVDQLTDCRWDALGGLVSGGDHEISGPGLHQVLEEIVSEAGSGAASIRN